MDEGSKADAVRKAMRDAGLSEAAISEFEQVMMDAARKQIEEMKLAPALDDTGEGELGTGQKWSPNSVNFSDGHQKARIGAAHTNMLLSLSITYPTCCMTRQGESCHAWAWACLLHEASCEDPASTRRPHILRRCFGLLPSFLPAPTQRAVPRVHMRLSLVPTAYCCHASAAQCTSSDRLSPRLHTHAWRHHRCPKCVEHHDFL